MWPKPLQKSYNSGLPSVLIAIGRFRVGVESNGLLTNLQESGTDDLQPSIQRQFAPALWSSDAQETSTGFASRSFPSSYLHHVRG